MYASKQSPQKIRTGQTNKKGASVGSASFVLETNVILVIDQPYVYRVQTFLAFFQFESHCIVFTESVY